MEYVKSEAKAYCKQHMKGVWAALTTPFKPDGELDEKGLRGNVRRCIDELKIDGFFCSGLMGEFWSLTPEERRKVDKIVCEESKGKAQVIAHTAHQNIREAVELSKHAEKAGATYVIMINPVYGANEDDEIYLYFESICKQIDIGLALFNQPKSGVTLSPALIERLCDIENICCVKNAVPNINHSLEVMRRAGERIVVSDPDEDKYYMLLAYLGQQVHMSSPTPYLYQVPGYLPIREYNDLTVAGKLEEASKKNYELEGIRGVRRKYFTTGPNGRTTAYLKEWTKLLGMAAGEPRPPIVPLTDQQRKEFRKDLEATGILDRIKR